MILLTGTHQFQPKQTKTGLPHSAGNPVFLLPPSRLTYNTFRIRYHTFLTPSPTARTQPTNAAPLHAPNHTSSPPTPQANNGSELPQRGRYAHNPRLRSVATVVGHNQAQTMRARGTRITPTKATHIIPTSPDLCHSHTARTQPHIESPPHKPTTAASCPRGAGMSITHD